MSAFAIFVIVLTFLYVVYYAAAIMQEVYGKSKKPKEDVEVFDIGSMTIDDAPIIVGEQGDSFFVGNQPPVLQDDESDGITFLDADSNLEDFLKEEKERMSSQERCDRAHSLLNDIETEMSGGQSDEEFLEQLVDQKPGAPKIFCNRTRF